MSSYNKLNGPYTQQSHDLLTKVLRDDWGYKGIVMTDWGAKAGTVDAVHAGNDLMEPGNQTEIDRIVEGVRSGKLSEADLDRNVRRMLEYVVKTPRFNGYKFSNRPDLKAHAQIAREGAAESMVLLRNEDGTLPVQSGKKVALYGISSVDFVAGGTGSGNVNKAYVVNMKQALEGAGFIIDKEIADYYDSYIAFDNAKKELTQSKGGWFSTPKLAEIDVPNSTIFRKAKENDMAVLVLGRNAGEGADRNASDFELSIVERDLLQTVSTAFHQEGKKVIVVLNIGGVIETYSWKNLVDAIILPWSPGQEGANAVADVMTGKVNPSGRLPMTFPVAFMDHPSSRNFPYNYSRPSAPAFGKRAPVKDVDYTKYEEGIWVGYRYFDTVDKEVSYPFGYGLSYTEFAYGKPVVKAVKGGFTVSVSVKNIGDVAGKEVVELYVSAPDGGLEKPEKELKAFAKTKSLAPGESQTVTLTVSDYELASYNENPGEWQTAAGTYTLHFGANVNEIRATAVYKVKSAETWQVSAGACKPVEELNLLSVK